MRTCKKSNLHRKWTGYGEHLNAGKYNSGSGTIIGDRSAFLLMMTYFDTISIIHAYYYTP